jgi:hypothetical protein
MVSVIMSIAYHVFAARSAWREARPLERGTMAPRHLFLGQCATALQAVDAPDFTRPPKQMLQILTSLPFIPTANVGSLHAENQILSGRCNCSAVGAVDMSVFSAIGHYMFNNLSMI